LSCDERTVSEKGGWPAIFLTSALLTLDQNECLMPSIFLKQAASKPSSLLRSALTSHEDESAYRNLLNIIASKICSLRRFGIDAFFQTL